MNRWEFGEGDRPLRIVEQGALIPKEPSKKMGPIIRGRASHDAVKIVGKALSFHEGFAAAVGAADKIAASGILAVKRLQDQVRLNCRLVNGAIPEVDHLLWMPDRPRRVTSPVAVVRARDGETALERFAKREDGDVARPTAVSDLPILSLQLQPVGVKSKFLKLISESEVGRVVALTSQWAGIADVAGTLTADVIVAWGRASFVRFSHGCCASKLAEANTRLAEKALVFSI